MQSYGGTTFHIAAVKMIPISEDWSEWSKCSDSCGGCGTQNRTLKLPNGTRIVHLRHCNPEPCLDRKEPCCEPFKFINGKCLIPQKTEGNEVRSKDQKKEAVVAWESIKDDDKPKFNNLEEQRKEAVLAWEIIKGTEFSDNKKFGNINLKETDILLNLTTGISIGLNDTRNSDNDDFTESSGELDEEMDSKINTTETFNLGITNADAPHGRTSLYDM
uniref:Thrombospondin type 1 domain-containing protein n=1 Tax=Loa loa TaxID=7209 RepID=A0A1I7VQI6_LOALO